MNVLFRIIFIAVLISGCGPKNEDNGNGSRSTCPDPKDTSIKGVQNNQWTTLDPPGNHDSQVHLQAINQSHGFSSLRWEVAVDRQTCSTGRIAESGIESYLQISYNPTAMRMQVALGLNFIEYTAYGCVQSVCTEVVEKGTIVLDVNYIK